MTGRLAGIVSLACAVWLTGCGGGERETPAAVPPAQPVAAVIPGCEPSGTLQYVCGPQNAEDLVRIGNTDWLAVSGMNGQLLGTNATGHLYLVNARTKSWQEWFPGPNPAFQPDQGLFGACPGPLDTKTFSAHGLALKEQSPGRYRMYMTSHGPREAIEVFDVDSTGAKPSITWIGCVVLPDRTFSNSVAILSDGGFVTTKMMDPALPDPFVVIGQGKVTGHVYEWHPGGKVTSVPGTELSGANGIEISSDNRMMFVTATGTRQLVRFDRSVSPPRKDAVEVPVAPDNIRWTADGKLLTSGANYVPPEQCPKAPCSTGWSVIEVDPATMTARRVAGADEKVKLQNASTGVRVGNDIWLGTYAGDRVAYMPAN